MRRSLSIALLALLAPAACSRESADAACKRAGPVEERAVKCAEAFVAAQGYTTATATADSATVQYELEDSGEWTALLQHRHGTLAPTAVGLCADTSGFNVIFEPTNDASHATGRAVRMERDLSEIRMAIPHFLLNALDLNVAGCRRLRP